MRRLRVLHSSDLHGQYKKLLVDHKDTEFDVWLDTGDFYPNRTRPLDAHVRPDEEQQFQGRWMGFKDLGPRLAAWLRGRPALTMPGNHDFVYLDSYLRKAKARAQRVTTTGVECLGVTWAGFREIPRINGEWAGEAVDFSHVVAETWATSPDILVTHAPPLGVLDEDDYGCAELAEALSTRAHSIRAHFFGHTHVDGGRQVRKSTLVFYNGATHAKVHELEINTRRRGP